MNPTGETTSQTTEASEKRRNGCSGEIQNCSEQDIHVLPETGDKNALIRKNEWSHVTTENSKYAVENDHSTRDLEGLCITFDRLAATGKPTGSPPCPENVHRAKRISHDIYNLACAASFGDSGEDQDGDLATEHREVLTVPSTISIFSVLVLDPSVGE